MHKLASLSFLCMREKKNGRQKIRKREGKGGWRIKKVEEYMCMNSPIYMEITNIYQLDLLLMTPYSRCY